jgi:hypothetical protein
MLDAFERTLAQHGQPVDFPVLQIAAGDLEQVSSQRLRDLARDCNAELLRRSGPESS